MAARVPARSFGLMGVLYEAVALLPRPTLRRDRFARRRLAQQRRELLAPPKAVVVDGLEDQTGAERDGIRDPYTAQAQLRRERIRNGNLDRPDRRDRQRRRPEHVAAGAHEP